MKFYDLDQAKPFGKETLGGKGFGLAEMHALGVPVPSAIIIPTEVCVAYMKDPAPVVQWVNDNVTAIYEALSAPTQSWPLVSVRSGARVSMPGMMDTILNVGLDDSTFTHWQKVLGTDCVLDCRRRLVKMFGSVVHGLKMESENVESAMLEWAKSMGGAAFPDAEQQLASSIIAVFNSWNNERAVYYRKMNNIPDEWGTAVVVQRMVFGNLNDKSATGVMFTRDPNTGDPGAVGEYLVNGQGEDVVDGSHTPLPLIQMKKWNKGRYNDLISAGTKLESHFGDVQDIEFTIEDGKLFILQTRSAKRTSQAAVKIALSYWNEGKMGGKPGLGMRLKRLVTFDQLCKVDVATVGKTKKHSFMGIAACSGVVIGKPVFTAEDAINCKEPCILVTEETTPEDIQGMDKALGVLTMNGGHTSHAAVVARSMNKPCIVGLGLEWHEALKTFNVDKIAIDGATGRVWLHEVPVLGGKCVEKDLLIEKVASLLGTPVVGVGIYDATQQLGAHDIAGVGDHCTKNALTPFSRDMTPLEKDFFSLFGPTIHTVPAFAPETVSGMQLMKALLG
jgi:pyruvate,orthophosphate dikinase